MAVTLAADEHAKVTGLYVADSPSLATIETNPRQLVREMEQARIVALQHLGQIEEAARDAGVECETYFDQENHSVPDAIAHLALRKHCDLVVMGTNRRRGLAGLMKPSNTKAVAKHLALPVLVVHLGDWRPFRSKDNRGDHDVQEHIGSH